MAITVTNIRRLGGSGGVFSNIATITMDSSYVTGGETLAAGDVGLASILDLVPMATTVGGWDISWDQDNSKLLAFGSSGGTTNTISKVFTVADMTDGGSTSGFVDFTASSLPAGAIPISSSLVVSGAFLGDVTATWKLGNSTNTGAYSAVTTNSCFTAITTESLPAEATGLVGTRAAITPRLTITSSTDFTLVKSNGTGAATANLNYMLPRALNPATMAQMEALSTQDISTVTFRVLVFGRG